MKNIKTIEEVLQKLDEIILWSKENESPVGYFAATYRVMTAQIVSALEGNVFENDFRMAKLDVAFAIRYLQAWENYKNKKTCTNSWYIAFEATKNKNLLILQHIFLGMNAHINLDLGVSAASIMPYRKISPLKKDFDTINSIIASINQNVQDSLNQLFYPLELVDQILQEKDNAVLDFAISKARETSWATAVVCSHSPNFLLDSVIKIVDNAAGKIALHISKPKILTREIASELKASESKNIAENIEILYHSLQ